MKFNLIKLILNFGKVQELISGVESYVNRLVHKQGAIVPNSDELVDILDAVSALISSGIIDIPGIDENAIAIRLNDIKAELQKTSQAS